MLTSGRHHPHSSRSTAHTSHGPPAQAHLGNPSPDDGGPNFYITIDNHFAYPSSPWYNAFFISSSCSPSPFPTPVARGLLKEQYSSSRVHFSLPTPCHCRPLYLCRVLSLQLSSIPACRPARDHFRLYFRFRGSRHTPLSHHRGLLNWSREEGYSL